MSFLAPITQTIRGCHGFFRGIKWLKSHPRYFFLLFLPIFLGLLLLFFGWGSLYQYRDEIFSRVLFAKPDSLLGAGLYYVAKAVVFGALVILGLLLYALFINILSSPIYDLVSMAVERELLGEKLPEINLWASLKLMGEELKKVLFILVLSTGILFVPFLNILTPLFAAFFVSWDLYDFPLARRGWSFRQRVAFVFSHGWGVLGLGLWLLIPGLQLFIMPLAVTGGTILAVEDLKKSRKIEQ